MSDVLLVEDEQIYRDTLAKALAREGCEVFQASGGRAAVRLGCAERPHVLVADWMLRNHFHGLHVARALQVVDPELQTVLITGFPSTDLSEEMERLGACQLVEKPFGIRELHDAVRRALDARRLGSVPRGAGVLDVGVLEVDLSGTIRYANAAAEVLFGRSPLPGLALDDLLVEGDIAAIDLDGSWQEVRTVERRAPLVLRARGGGEQGRRLLVACRAGDRASQEEPRVRLLLDLVGAPEPRWPFSARVLVVDPDPVARRYTVRLLERAGCTCFPAERHDLALRILAVDYGIHFALFTLQGAEEGLRAAVQQIRGARSDLKLIGTGAEPRDVANLGLDGFLTKPWTLDDLAVALRAP